MFELVRKRITPQVARWIAWVFVGVFNILVAIGLFLSILTNTTPSNVIFPIILFVIAVTTVGAWSVIGALIISRHPHHPVGWLLMVTFPVVAIDMFTLGYASFATFNTPDLPMPGFILIWLNWSGLPFAVVTISLLYLFFPTGKLLTQRWRLVGWTAVAALFIFLCLQTIEPGPLSLFPNLDNPYAVAEPTWAVLSPFYFTLIAILTLCSLAALISLFLRMRQAKGDERQQVKWLVMPATIYWIGIPFNLLTEYDSSGFALDFGVGLHLISVPLIVGAVALAIFKYRLYDIDIIINRTLVYGALTAVIVTLYILIVGGAGLVIQTNANLAGVLITAVLIAIIFRPLRIICQQGVDRLLYGSAGLSLVASFGEKPTQQAPLVPDTTPSTLSPPKWLKVARLAWYPTAVFVFGIFLAAIPGFFILGSEGIIDPRFSASPSLLIKIILRVTIVMALLTSLASLLLAVLLFRRRADDHMALLTSFLLLAYSVIMSGPLEALEPFIPGIATFTTSILIPLFQPFILLLFAIFPDGRFVPSWTKWAIFAIFFISPFSLIWATQLTQSPLDFSQPDTAVILGVNTVLFIAILSVILYAQVYRYRRVSTLLQKQQTKWVLYGIGLWFTIQFLSGIPWIYTYSLPSDTPYPPWLAIVTPIWFFSIISIPLTLTIAVMRYRLFDIDFLINRSLMYGALTVVVVTIYVLVVGALGLFFQAQGNLIVALLATGIVAVLFQPLRERLQRGVNRLIYGERDDPIEALSRLGKSLETALPTDRVLLTLVETIAQTLKLPFVGITLHHHESDRLAAQTGKPVDNPLEFSLTFQGETMGYLLVAPRSREENFTSAETRLLRNLARQAGAAVHNAQLTADLQHSRQQLVITREEERLRLRRDLHDGLGPALASVVWQADSARDLVYTDPAEAVNLLESSIEQAQAALADIRRLVYGLRPPALDELGLVGALQQSVRQYQQTAVTIESHQPLPPLPAAVEVAAYRIVQESLKNAVEHGSAKTCLVCLTTNGSLEIAIRDDGVGLPEVVTLGIGLVSMRERAEELGGAFSIERGERGGTAVTVILPLTLGD